MIPTTLEMDCARRVRRVRPRQELTITQIARVLGCQRVTVWSWIHRGRLCSRQRGLLREHLVTVRDLRRFCRTHHYDLSEDLLREEVNRAGN